MHECCCQRVHGGFLIFVTLVNVLFVLSVVIAVSCGLSEEIRDGNGTSSCIDDVECVLW